MPVQSPPHTLPRLPKLGANLLKLRARPVLNVAPRVYNLPDALFKVLGEGHGFGNRRKQWIALGDTAEEAFGVARGRKEKLAIEQLLRFKNFALLRYLVEEGPRVYELLHRWRRVFEE